MIQIDPKGVSAVSMMVESFHELLANCEAGSPKMAAHLLGLDFGCHALKMYIEQELVSQMTPEEMVQYQAFRMDL